MACMSQSNLGHPWDSRGTLRREGSKEFACGAALAVPVSRQKQYFDRK